MLKLDLTLPKLLSEKKCQYFCDIMETQKQHHYKTSIAWTGNKGSGTSHYSAYDRSHVIAVQQKADIQGSSDPAFRGDSGKHNPEELLLASISACHMLWYLHLCADKGIVVQDYVDDAEGVMVETAKGGGHFTGVTLHPRVTIEEEQMKELALALHHTANEHCFIANSLNFKVSHAPIILVAKKQPS